MKKNYYNVMNEETIEILTGIYCTHDEDTILPLMLAVDGIVLAYYKRKYGDLINIEDLIKLTADLRRLKGEYEMSDDEFEHLDNFTYRKIGNVENGELKDDEIPFS